MQFAFIDPKDIHFFLENNQFCRLNLEIKDFVSTFSNFLGLPVFVAHF